QRYRRGPGAGGDARAAVGDGMPPPARTEPEGAHLAVEVALFRLHDNHAGANAGAADCGGFGGLLRHPRVVPRQLEQGSSTVIGSSCGALRRGKRTTQPGGTHRARQMESGAVGRRPPAREVWRKRGVAGHGHEGTISRTNPRESCRTAGQEKRNVGGYLVAADLGGRYFLLIRATTT